MSKSNPLYVTKPVYVCILEPVDYVWLVVLTIVNVSQIFPLGDPSFGYKEVKKVSRIGCGDKFIKLTDF